ncbi:MAG: glycerol-3-phosphate 1-O-acyltransferase PlsY [Capsulimonadales bacterium]|nr:glycerol-3-phosphate 1-O-acyltransferase PlsY [Capsulimonadales bacterium]
MKDQWVPGLPIVCLAFVLGSVPFGYLAGRLMGKDLRQLGSGNIGATNTLRHLGKGPGIAVLILDALKGFLPTQAAAFWHLSGVWIVATGLAAMLGHIFSPFLRFKGGKGVATGLGVMLALSPAAAAVSAAVFAVTVYLTRYVSLGSILAAVTMVVLLFLLNEPLPYRLFGLLAAIFVLVRHKENIRRLLAGTENRFGEGKSEKKER